jgi:prepilin signal peptidase PulO-like enzyme (type II secretory pathway)
MVALLFLSLLLVKGPSTSTLIDMAFAASMIVLIFVDAQHKILPNSIVYPGLVLAVAARALLPNIDGVFWPTTSLSNTQASIFCGAAVMLSAPLLLAFDFGDWKLMGHKFVDDDEDDEEPTSYLFPVTIIIGVALGAGVIAWGIEHRLSPNAVDSVIGAIVGAIIGAAFFWLTRFGYYIFKGREGMGLGDAKMMAYVGAYLGWRLVFLTTFVGVVLGAVIGVIYLRLSNKGPRETLPLGVFLGAAALISLFFGHEIVSWWLGTFR